MYLAKVVQLIFNCYIFLILARIVGSWFPAIRSSKMMRFAMYYTEPYLGFFRRLIPPIGGVLDLSPLLGLVSLQLAQMLIINWLL